MNESLNLVNPEISEFLRERLKAGDFPSAVYLVAEKGEVVFQDALGSAVVGPRKIEARVDTIYDVASLTKVLVTGLLATKLLESNELSLTDTLALHFLPEKLNDKSGITVEQLLTHVSGLPAWRPFYLLVNEPSDIANEILATPVDSKTVTYSDLNFLLLESLLNKVTGSPLDRLARQLILGPLGLSDTQFHPPESLRERIAASEKGNEYEKQTCIDQGYLKPSASDAFFRTNTIWGEVHDGNAYFMGGVAGHAGLFSTAQEAFKIALQFLPNYTTVLKPKTCELFRTNFTPGMNESRSLAFQLASTKDSTAGNRMSAESFGHLGFTGTSLWIDPVKERIFILLTNRTHHDLPFVNINSVRRRFHDLAIGELSKISSN